MTTVYRPDEPSLLLWCVLCGEHYVREASAYTCPLCPAERPCPTGSEPFAWLPEPVGS